jgi:hypothetical protein
MNDSMNALMANHINALHHFSCFFQNSSSNYINLSDIEIGALMEKTLSHEGQQKVSMYYIGAINFLVRENGITFAKILEDGTTGYGMLIHSATTAIDKILEAANINPEVTAPILLSSFFGDIAREKLNNPSYLSNFDHITQLGYKTCQLYFNGKSEIKNAGGKIFYVDHDYVHPHYIQSFIFDAVSVSSEDREALNGAIITEITRNTSNEVDIINNSNNEVFEDPSIHNDDWYDIKNSEQYQNEVVNNYLVESFKIDKQKIGDLIGPGAENIEYLQDITDCNINIEEDGTVNVSGLNKASIDDAILLIKKDIANEYIEEDLPF